MGESAAETVNEIERTRARLSAEIDELADRVPDWMGRIARLAMGGGLGGAAFWFVLGRVRKRLAGPPVPSPAQVHVEASLVPEHWLRQLDTREVKRVALAVGAVWFGLKIAELRELRRLEARRRSGF
jgi:hypothetical protein